MTTSHPGSTGLKDSAIMVQSPSGVAFQGFDNARQALTRLLEFYQRNTAYLRDAFLLCLRQGFPPRVRYRAFYPALRIQVDTYQEVDSRLSFGHVVEPGIYETTITEDRKSTRLNSRHVASSYAVFCLT